VLERDEGPKSPARCWGAVGPLLPGVTGACPGPPGAVPWGGAGSCVGPFREGAVLFPQRRSLPTSCHTMTRPLTSAAATWRPQGLTATHVSWRVCRSLTHREGSVARHRSTEGPLQHATRAPLGLRTSRGGLGGTAPAAQRMSMQAGGCSDREGKTVTQSTALKAPRDEHTGKGALQDQVINCSCTVECKIRRARHIFQEHTLCEELPWCCPGTTNVSTKVLYLQLPMTRALRLTRESAVGNGSSTPRVRLKHRRRPSLCPPSLTPSEGSPPRAAPWALRPCSRATLTGRLCPLAPQAASPWICPHPLLLMPFSPPAAQPLCVTAIPCKHERTQFRVTAKGSVT